MSKQIICPGCGCYYYYWEMDKCFICDTDLRKVRRNQILTYAICWPLIALWVIIFLVFIGVK